MTIQQCKYVLEISKYGSFNEAAKELFIAQSSLSASVKSLEKEIGITIFERSKHGVVLTVDGAEFVRYASQITEYDDFITNRYLNPNKYERLYISTQHYDFIADIFAKLLKEIDTENYKISLREIRTYDVIKEVTSAYSDIGILAIKNDDNEIMERYLQKNGLNFTEILKVKPHVFLKKEHKLAKKSYITLEDLRTYPYISYEQGEHNSSFFIEELSFSQKHNKHIEISDRATLMNVLLTTDGYTIGTGIMPSVLNNSNIVSVPLKSHEFYRIGYILRSDRKNTYLTRVFIEKLNCFANNIKING